MIDRPRTWEFGRTGHTPRRWRHAIAVSAAVAAILAGCGESDDNGSGASTAPTAAATTAAPETTAVPPTTPDTTAAPATTATDGVVLDQPAIWPAPDVVFATPEEAATDFVDQVLGVAATLGDFRSGDARSGEIDVLVTPEPGGRVVPRGVLFVRRLGPTDGWYVIGAASDGATITAPSTMDEVPAGALTVEGVARGFEGTIVVTAFPAGRADLVIDEAITAGGVFESPEPFEAELDLTGASAGDVVALLVRGDAGSATDTGDFTAIPVVIAGS